MKQNSEVTVFTNRSPDGANLLILFFNVLAITDLRKRRPFAEKEFKKRYRRTVHTVS